jgi:Ca2+-binding RTX toxin-like protein
MAAFTFSTMTTGQVFDPNVDTLNFGTTFPTSLVVSNIPPQPGFVNITVGATTKTINMSAATGVDLNNPILSLKTSAFIFSSGAVFRVGDGLVSSAGDDGNLVVNGTAGSDRLQVFGGNDTVNAGAGNDLVTLNLGVMGPTAGLPTADVLDGGDGFDTLFFNIGSGGGVNVFMSSGSANWFSNGSNAVVSLNNFESVSGTAGSDFMAGGLAGFSWADYDWTAPSVGYVDTQTFRGSAGFDTLGGDGLADGLRQVADYSSLSGAISMQVNGGDQNPWRTVMKPTGASGSLEMDQLYSVTRIVGTNVSGIDSVTGGSKSGVGDWLMGGSSVRTQFGSLQEEFMGGAGNDTIEGFGGFDLVLYNSAAAGAGDTLQGFAGVVVDLDSGTATDGIDVNAGLAGMQAGTDTLMDIEGVVGSNYNDSLTGSDANNYFQMRSGNDSVDGRGGFDMAAYQGSTTGVNVSLAVVGAQVTGKTYILSTGATAQGTDTLVDIESLRGSDFNDTLTGGGVTDWRGLTGIRREDFEGRAGNDVIDGGNDHAANLAIYGDESVGYDIAKYERAPEAVAIDMRVTATDAGGTYILVDDGYGTQDKLYNINGLAGTRFDDVLIGNAESNTFLGNAGDDVIDGNEGTDSVRYDSALEGVHVDLDSGIAYDGMGYWVDGPMHMGMGGMNMGYWVDGGMDKLANIEAAVGSNFDDKFFGDAGANKFWGMSGFDMFDARDAGNDTLYGGMDDDFYMVKVGDVVVEYAGEGVDTVVSNGNFTIAAGNDIENLMLRGGNSVTGLGRTGTGNAIANSIVGTQFNDTLKGMDGNDTLIGGKGNDLIKGGNGIDTLSFATATNAVDVSLNDATAQNTGEGTDTISEFENLVGGAFADTLVGRDVGTTLITNANLISGGGGNDRIFGLGGNDTLEGGNGHDEVDGGAGNDILLGGNGNDLIVGGVGLDTMTGGAGADNFRFVTMSDAGSQTPDTITDFQIGNDKIQLIAGNFTGLVAGVAVVVDVKGANNLPNGTGPRFIFNQASGWLKFDYDGTGAATTGVWVAQLTGVTTLSSGDFSVITAPT